MTFASSIKWIWLGLGQFNRPDSEISYFYGEFGHEVAFFKYTAELGTCDYFEQHLNMKNAHLCIF